MNTASTKITYSRIAKVLEDALIRDRNRILAKARKVFGTRQRPVAEPDEEKVTELALEAAAAVESAQKRAEKIPEITYPEQLPVKEDRKCQLRTV